MRKKRWEVLFQEDPQEYSHQSENGALDEAYNKSVVFYMLGRLGFLS